MHAFANFILLYMLCSLNVKSQHLITILHVSIKPELGLQFFRNIVKTLATLNNNIKCQYFHINRLRTYIKVPLSRVRPCVCACIMELASSLEGIGSERGDVAQLYPEVGYMRWMSQKVFFSKQEKMLQFTKE